MSRLGLIPRVTWPVGQTAQLDGVLQSGEPDLPWLGGWIASTVPIGGSVRLAFEAVQPLAQMLAIAGHRIVDAYLVRNGEAIHFDSDDRSVDTEMPPLEGSSQLAAEIVFRTLPFDHVPTDSSRATVAVALTLPGGTGIDPTPGADSYLSLDVSAASTLNEVATLLEAWSIGAADSVADQLVAAYAAQSSVDGLLSLFTSPISVDLEHLAPEQATIVQQAIYNTINSYNGIPALVPLTSRMPIARLELMLADERVDEPVPMAQRLIDYFESAGGARQIDRVRNEQQLQSAADAVDFDHRKETLFTIIFRLHDEGFADILGGFASPPASDWPWVEQRLANDALLELEDVERIRDALAVEETQAATIPLLDRLKNESAVTFADDPLARSLIRQSFVNAIGQAPLEPSAYGNARELADGLYSLLEPDDPSVDLAEVTEAIEDTWAHWQIAMDSTAERSLRSTALFVFRTAPTDIRAAVVNDVADHFSTVLNRVLFDHGAQWASSGEVDEPPDEYDGWTSEMQRALVDTWTRVRSSPGVQQSIPAPDVVLRFVGESPFEVFDRTRFVTEYETLLRDSTVPELETMNLAFRALNEYSAAGNVGDRTYCARFDTHALNDVLASSLADDVVQAELAAVREEAFSRAAAESGLTASGLAERQLAWCSSELVAGYWLGLTPTERSAAVVAWRDLAAQIDPLSSSTVEAGIASLDVVASVDDVVDDMDDAQIDQLFSMTDITVFDPDELALGKQVLKFHKSVSGMGKSLYLARLTNFVTDSPPPIVVDPVSAHLVFRWKAGGPYDVGLRDFERQILPTLGANRAAVAQEIWEFRDEVRQQIATDMGGNSTGTVAGKFDRVGKAVSFGVGVYAAFQLYARVHEVEWDDVSSSDVMGGVGELRDVAGGILDVAVLMKKPLEGLATRLSATAGANVNLFFQTVPAWFSIASAGLSAIKYAYDALRALERGDYTAASIYSLASLGSGWSAYLLFVGMTGAGAVIGLVVVAMVTAFALWRLLMDWLDELEYRQFLADRGVLLASTVFVVPPVDATIVAENIVDAGTPIDSSVGVLEMSTEATNFRDEVEGQWGDVDGVSGALRVAGVTIELVSTEPSPQSVWEVSCPFAGRYAVYPDGERPSAFRQLGTDPLFMASPQCEVWYDNASGDVFEQVFVETGDTVEVGQMLAVAPGGSNVLAERAGVVHIIDEHDVESGDDPEIGVTRIRVRTRR